MYKSSITATVASADLSAPGRIRVHFKLTRWEQGSTGSEVIGAVDIDQVLRKPVGTNDIGPAIENAKAILADDLDHAVTELRESDNS